MDGFQRGGYAFDVSDGGDPDGPAVVLLHGFPQDLSAWSEVSPLLHQAGYRTLAPSMRGASQGARPTSAGAYRSIEHVEDIIGLLDEAGLEQAHIVGHDWGGYVAWVLAGMHPERARSLASISTPHPTAWKRAMLRSTQALQSWYIGLFQVPYVAERAMAPGSPLWKLMARDLPADHEHRYAERMADPQTRKAALNWYRVMPRELTAPSVPAAKISVPSLYVWGERDPVFSRGAAEATAEYVTGPYRYEVFGAGHWIPEQQPTQLAELLVQHFAAA